MQACAECILCLLGRDIAAVPPEVSPEERADYLRAVMAMLADTPAELCTPQLSRRIDGMYRERFGPRKEKNFAQLKRVYNERMLALEDRLTRGIDAADDPLAYALELARTGNYIDFGAKHEVDDALLERLLGEAKGNALDPAEYQRLCADLAQARSVAYVTDNCGELVLDKLALRVLLRRYPNARFTLLTRGADTLNDATVDDARAVGLAELLPVMGNGTDYPGTVLSEISAEARALLAGSDVIIAKGQANFETMNGCGWNVYYLLLCKCDLFIRRFQKPRLTGLLVNERRVPPLR